MNCLAVFETGLYPLQRDIVTIRFKCVCQIETPSRIVHNIRIYFTGIIRIFYEDRGGNWGDVE